MNDSHDSQPLSKADAVGCLLYLFGTILTVVAIVAGIILLR